MERTKISNTQREFNELNKKYNDLKKSSENQALLFTNQLNKLLERVRKLEDTNLALERVLINNNKK